MIEQERTNSTEKKEWEDRQWEIRKPVRELIEKAQTCKELELAQEKYMRLDSWHWWLPIDFFSERAKELADYNGSSYQWAEEAFDRHREFVESVEELYAEHEND